MLLKRFWRFTGWTGIAGVAFLGVVVSLTPSLKEVFTPAFSRLLAGLLVLFIGIVVASSRYSFSARTQPHDEVVSGLLASGDRFCLILRPFGADGEVVLPQAGRRLWSVGQPAPNVTIEQVISIAVRKSLGLKSYAMVDQDLLLAPPGPVYMRAPHAHWRASVELLIEHAYVIALLLPPGQQIRGALEWELQQITGRAKQSRVLIVLPPPDQDAIAHATALHQACVLLAALEDFCGTVEDADPLKVLHYEMSVHDKTIVLRWSDGTFHMGWPQDGKGAVAVKTYLDCLSPFLTDLRREADSAGV